MAQRPFFPPRDFARIQEGLEQQLASLPKAPEGHISPDQAEYLYHFIRLIRPKFVVETGFCVGYSASIMMNAQKSVGIDPCCMSIDNCHHAQTKAAAGALKLHYQNFVFVVGDSKTVLAGALHKYMREHQDLPLDLGIVDGGHDAETALYDLETLFAFLRPGGYLWLDDFETAVPCGGVNLAGRDFARKWGHCQRYRTADGRGFMIYQKSF